MRLSRRTAAILLLIWLAGPWLPDLRLGPAVRVDAAGFLLPTGLALWLVATADAAHERRRALATALVTGAVAFAASRWLPPRPLHALPLDPMLLLGLVAGATAYLAGRSRRAAFAGALLGMAAFDLLTVLANLARGIPGPLAALGGGGVYDGAAVAAFTAVLLAEAVGEGREYLTRPAAPGPAARGAAAGVAAVGLAVVSAWAADRWGEPPQELTPAEAARGAYWRLLDPAGRTLSVGGLRIRPGDLYLDHRDRAWRVERVHGRVAWARPAGLPPPPDPAAPEDLAGAAGLLENLRRLLRGEGSSRSSPGERDPLIVILHTHNDESYLLDQGTSSIPGRGGIHRVGAALANALRERGYRAIHDETIHLPHDDFAYLRSRRTILSYLPLRPTMVLDLHRNAAPPDFYADHVNGRGITRVRIVVGRQNPRMRANLTAARRLKAIADRIHPGFIRDIFISAGDYNQDLGPRVLLLEVGAHTNALASAVRSMEILARVLDAYLRAYPDRP